PSGGACSTPADSPVLSRGSTAAPRLHDWKGDVSGAASPPSGMDIAGVSGPPVRRGPTRTPLGPVSDGRLRGAVFSGGSSQPRPSRWPSGSGGVRDIRNRGKGFEGERR